LGNTVIIIEHNLDVIRSADWILDLGPEGGEEGGRLVAKGTPAEVAATLGSHTGEFLRRYFPVAELKPIPASSPEGNGKRGVKSAGETNKSAVRKRKSSINHVE
jgi:excinuclease ABC subunit A